MKKGLFLSIFSTLLLSGCATKYDPGKSRALNLTTHGFAVNHEMRDAEVPKDTIADLNGQAFSYAVDLGTAANSFISPAPGFSNYQALGINLVGMLLAPTDTPQEKNSLFAWIPAKDVPDGLTPRQHFLNILRNASQKALADMDITYDVTDEYTDTRDSWSYTPQTYYSVPDQSINCETGKYTDDNADRWCVMSIGTGTSSKETAPEYLNTEDVYRISGARVFLRNSAGNTTFPEMEFYQRLSHNLPSWAFIYLAPNKVRINPENKLKYPLVLEKGQPLFFVMGK